MDNKRVYDRRDISRFVPTNPIHPLYVREEEILNFHICGKQYQIREYKGKLYHTAEELLKLDKLIKGKDRYGGISIGGWYSGWYSGWYNGEDNKKGQKAYELGNHIDTDINKKNRQPVLIEKGKDNYEVPLLKDYGFPNIIEARDLYIQVETFLGWLVDNPPLPDKQSNIGKIEGHGFDKKTSFRPNIKQK
jgi:hypothetical protein